MIKSVLGRFEWNTQLTAEFAQATAAVLNVATGLCDERCGVRLACLAWWRWEAGEFVGGAFDSLAVNGDAEEAREEVAKGR